MHATFHIDNEEVQAVLSGLRMSIADRSPILKILGERMRTSIALTFREEGSPAGSWPALAESTKKKPGYTSGHKLLVMSGRLFNSFTYVEDGTTLTIGTSLVYAAVHQFGSRDWMGGAAGPRAKNQLSQVEAHSTHRLRAIHYRLVSVIDRKGKERNVPRPVTTGVGVVKDKAGRERKHKLRFQGPRQDIASHVRAHLRRQNIPARPFLVFRPEDPQRLVAAVESHLRGKGVTIGTAGVA